MLLWKEGKSTQSYLRAQDICCVAVFKSSTVSVFCRVQQSSIFHRRTVPSDFSAQYKWNPWACQRCRSWICSPQSCLWLCSPITSLFKWENMSTKYASIVTISDKGKFSSFINIWTSLCNSPSLKSTIPLDNHFTPAWITEQRKQWECISWVLMKLTVFTMESSTNFKLTCIFFTASVSWYMLQWVCCTWPASLWIQAATLLWWPVIALVLSMQAATHLQSPFYLTNSSSSWNVCLAVVLVSSDGQNR